MWLEHISSLIEKTDMDNLYNDIPLAIFIIKLINIKINLSGIENKQKYQDYIDSEKHCDLRYFIQVTMNEEIENECLQKEKELEDEIKSLDEIFKVESYESNSALGPGIILKTPLYEDRMVLYTNYMEGSYVKYDISDYWTNRNINFDNNNNKPTWKLMDYYEYFKKSILNKDNIERKGYSTFYISKYRNLQKQIKDIIKICSNKRSFLIVLESIRDIKVSNLMEKIDKGKLIY